jgi:hypothetical protein
MLKFVKQHMDSITRDRDLSHDFPAHILHLLLCAAPLGSIGQERIFQRSVTSAAGGRNTG